MKKLVPLEVCFCFVILGSMLNGIWADVVIVGDELHATIVLPAQADAIEKWSADFLSDTIEKSTGIHLEIIREGENTSGNVIYIGQTKESNKFANKLKPLNRDGFVISAVDGQVVIVGKTPVGTEYGIYEFLESYLGVRWLFPGEIGTHIPKHKKLCVPDGLLVSQPAFISRQFSDYALRGYEPRKNDNDIAHFMRHNRMRLGMKFHHAMFHLFPPGKFGKSNPEFYPFRNGKSVIPSSRDIRFWQPCFTAEGLAETAAKEICTAFASRLDDLSRPIGINDTSTHWCQCESCRKLDGNRQNSLGGADKSHSYFTWANRVAELVHKKYPSKKLGFLAYCNLIDPPADMELNPMLVPYLTYDRMYWLDQKLQKKDKDRTRCWKKKLPEVGWYDYIYGDHRQGTRSYLAPRIYFHLMDDYISWAHANGVKHYYAEAYPAEDWHEGPKLYLLLKLLWNPDVDVDEALNDWYVAAVGPEAAPHLAAYFNMWEEIWTKRVPKTKWFQNRADKKQFLDFRSEAYMDALVQADLDILGKHIRAMRLAAKGEDYKKRANFIADSAEKRLEALSEILRVRYVQSNPQKFPWNEIKLESSFDRNFDGWGTWQKHFAKGKFSWTSRAGHTKPGAIMINASGANKGSMVIKRDISIEKGKTYRFSAYLDTSGFEEDSRVLLNFRFKDKKGRYVDGVGNFIASMDDLNSQTWKAINLVVDIPKSDPSWDEVKTATCFVSVRNAGIGVLLIDDLVFGEIKTPSR